MQDRPGREELLQGIVRFLESDLVPVLEEPLRFHTRVAANLLRIIGRENVLEETQMRREARELRCLLGEPEPPGQGSAAGLREEVVRLNRELCRRIRSGAADSGPWHQDVLVLLRETVREKLEIANPAVIRETAKERR
ncbi:MAG: adaptin domain-containing protein [Desulfobacterota bacterium]|jgi:hypothetical protein|nr:adaptin domain-containing protein [Thermodesulfobacteriota bacterium]